MKKTGIAFAGLLLIAVIYYFTAGSEQLTEEMKVRVNTELNHVAQNGFAVQEREVKAKSEHFVILFDDPKKIVAFIKTQGSDMTLEDAEMLKGLKLGVDLQYLNDSYSALSADVYPLNLPPLLDKSGELDDTDKAVLKQLNEMLARKVLLVHIDFNKMLSSFKGYIKDIHEKLTVETVVGIDLEGSTFEGTIAEDRIHTMQQAIKKLRIVSGDELDIVLHGLTSDYTASGKTPYDSSSNYAIETFKIAGKRENNTFSFTIKNIKGNNEISVKDKLAANTIKVTIDEMIMTDNGQESKLKQTLFTFNIGNIDITVLEKLEKLDVNDQEAANQLVQELISKGITMEIPAFEVKRVLYQGQEIDGFTLSSSFEINKHANLAAIQSNPLAGLSAINTKTKLTLSEGLYTLIAQQPQAMLLTMLIQPKVINGKKVYEVELKDGKLTVNGSPLM